MPTQFYNLVWDVLQRTPLGITTQGHHLPAVPTLTSMSRSELSFSLLVEETMHHISQPERRQVVVESVCIVATILSRYVFYKIPSYIRVYFFFALSGLEILS